MTNDLYRDDDPMDDAERAAVYVFLRRTRSDLTRHLEQVLPVDTAIAATIGPDPKSPEPMQAARSLPPLTMPGWFASVAIIVIAVMRKITSAGWKVLAGKRQGLWAGHILDTGPRSVHSDIETDIALLAQLANNYRKPKSGAGDLQLERHRAAAAQSLRELQIGLRERELSKENALSLMSVARRNMEAMFTSGNGIMSGIGHALITLALGSMMVISALVDGSSSRIYFTSGTAAYMVYLLCVRWAGGSVRSQWSQARTILTRLRKAVEQLFDDSEDHTDTILRH